MIWRLCFQFCFEIQKLEIQVIHVIVRASWQFSPEEKTNYKYESQNPNFFELDSQFGKAMYVSKIIIERCVGPDKQNVVFESTS